MDSFSRPKEKNLYEKKMKIDSICPECRGRNIAAYRVLTDGGWWDVVKCQDCLYSMERERCENQYAPCTLLWKLM